MGCVAIELISIFLIEARIRNGSKARSAGM